MPQGLARDLDPAIVRQLKARARRYRRSLQAELRDILEQAARRSAVDPRAKINHVRAMFAGRTFSDSAALIRRDRAR
mgnify:CR=1 FL=1